MSDEVAVKLVAALLGAADAMHAYAASLERWVALDAQKEATDAAYREEQIALMKQSHDISRRNYEAAQLERDRAEEFRQRELEHMEKCERRFQQRVADAGGPASHIN